MDKAIITALMIIAGVVCAVLLFSAVYPAVTRGGEAIARMEGRIGDRMQSQIEIIYASGQSSNSDVSVWVKNIGSSRISAVEKCDLFFGPEGNFARIPYGTGTPHWEYSLENDTEWNPSTTLKVLIRYGAGSPSSGRHFLKMIAPNGIADEYYFNIE